MGGNFSPPPGRFLSFRHLLMLAIDGFGLVVQICHLSPPSRLVFSRLPSGQEEMQRSEHSLLHFSSSPHHPLRRVRAVSSNFHLSPPSGLVFFSPGSFCIPGGGIIGGIPDGRNTTCIVSHHGVCSIPPPPNCAEVCRQRVRDRYQLGKHVMDMVWL